MPSDSNSNSHALTTTTTNTSADADITAAGEGDGLAVHVLLDQLQQAANDASAEVLRRMEVNHETVRCLWDGQSDDGRKRANALGYKPFPWEGASDARVRLAEEVVRDRVLVRTATFDRAEMQAVPREAGDAEQAAVMTLSLAYVTGVQMAGELRRQWKLFSSYTETYGHAVMGVRWLREMERYPVYVTVEGLAAGARQEALQMAAVDGDGEVEAELAAERAEAEVREMVLDPEARDELADMLRTLGEGVTAASARKCANALASEGAGHVIATRQRENRPQWRALLPYVDVFYPLTVESMQSAPWVAEVMWLTRGELQGRAAAEGWDKTWVSEVMKRPGRAFEPESWGLDRYRWALSAGGVRTTTSEEAERSLFQVIEVTYRASEDGADGALLRRAVVHGGYKERAAYDGPCPYAHGDMPYFDLRTEEYAPTLTASRGTPELVQSEQLEVKLQRDARADGTTISTLPPLEVPTNQAGRPIDLRPLAQIPNPNRRTGRIEWFAPPPADGYNRSADHEERVRGAVDRYFRRPSEQVPPLLTELENADLAGSTLEALSRGTRLTAALMQQYMDPVTATRINGMPVDLRASRDDIQGSFDFDFVFDARDLNSEYLLAKYEAIANTVLPLDSEAVVNRGALIRWLVKGIDPRLASEIVQDPGQAGIKELEEEQEALDQVLNGLEPRMREGGENHALRAQYLQQMRATNPSVQKQLTEDPVAGKIFDNRLQHHLHQVQQQQNAVIGRTGAPSLPIPGPNAA